MRTEPGAHHTQYLPSGSAQLPRQPLPLQMGEPLSSTNLRLAAFSIAVSSSGQQHLLPGPRLYQAFGSAYQASGQMGVHEQKGGHSFWEAWDLIVHLMGGPPTAREARDQSSPEQGHRHFLSSRPEDGKGVPRAADKGPSCPQGWAT